MTRTWSFGFTEKNFPQRSKVVQQVRCLLGGKRVRYVWINTWANSERVSPSGSSNHLYAGVLLGFLWPIILICPVQGLYSVYPRVILCEYLHLSATMDSGRWVNLASLFFGPPRSLLAGKASLTSRMRICGLLPFIWAGPSLLSWLSCHGFWSVCLSGIYSNCFPQCWGQGAASCLSAISILLTFFTNGV